MKFNDPVLLIGNGKVNKKLYLRAKKLAPKVTIAVDGGANHLYKIDNQAMPNAIIGDLDSINPHVKNEYASRKAKIIDLSDDQNTTDFEKSLQNIIAPLYAAIGFDGERLDHRLAALHALKKFKNKPVLLYQGNDVAFMAPKIMQSNFPHNTNFSLFPLGNVTVKKSEGLKYPADNITFDIGKAIGTSNQTSSNKQYLEFSEDGKMLVIVPQALAKKAAQIISKHKITELS